MPVYASSRTPIRLLVIDHRRCSDLEHSEILLERFFLQSSTKSDEGLGTPLLRKMPLECEGISISVVHLSLLSSPRSKKDLRYTFPCYHKELRISIMKVYLKEEMFACLVRQLLASYVPVYPMPQYFSGFMN